MIHTRCYLNSVKSVSPNFIDSVNFIIAIFFAYLEFIFKAIEIQKNHYAAF